jgi:hypothetical protein
LLILIETLLIIGHKEKMQKQGRIHDPALVAKRYFLDFLDGLTKKKKTCYRRMDRQTNQPTNGRTRPLIESTKKTIAFQQLITSLVVDAIDQPGIQ